MTITSPTGREYQWDKETPPSQADIDALVQYDASLGKTAPAEKGFGQRAGEVAGDIAVEAGPSIAGQLIGAATGPGYALIAPAAGSYGNYLKQQREIDRGEREKLSYGEMLASGLINLIPASSAGKTAISVAKSVGKQAVIGAGISTGTKAAEQVIDEGRFPSIDDYQAYLDRAASGATVGGAVGVAGAAARAFSPAVKKLWGKMAGKTQEEVAQKLQTIAETGTESERQAASEMMDEIGTRLGLVREIAPKSAQESAAVMGAVPVKSAKEAASVLAEAPLTAEEIASRRVGSLEPKSARESAEIMGAIPVPAKSAQESAELLMQQMSPAEKSALAFSEAYGQGQSPAAAQALRGRLAGQQALSEQNLARASQFEQARAEELQQALRGGQVAGPESTILTGGPERAQLSILDTRSGAAARERARLRQKLGIQEEVLPTTEDVLNEFGTLPGVGSKQRAKKMSMEGGSVAAGTMAGVAAVGGAAAAGASMAKPEERTPDIVEVVMPNGQAVRYNTADWPDRSKIEEDANKKWVEMQKIAAADPHLKLKDAWANAQTPEDRMELMWNWMTGKRGAAIATKMGIQAAGSQLGPVGRVASGPISEYAASRIEGVPATTGRMAQSAIEMLPRGGQGMLANALRFAGAGVLGEGARQAIDENKFINLKDAAQAASEGGLTAVPMRIAERGKAAQSEYGRLKRDMGEVRLLRDANEAGFALDPGAMTPGIKQKAMVGLAGGSTQFDQFLSRINGPILEQKFRNVAGVAPNTKLGPEVYAAKRLEAGSAYSEAAKVSTKASAAVEEWKQANGEMARAYKKYSNSLLPEDLKAAKAQKARADAAFAEIESEAHRAGRPQIAKDVQEARAKYAQLYAMEEATNDIGRVNNAALLGFMYNDGVPFTGDLAIVARIAANQPQVLQDTSKIQIRAASPKQVYPVPAAMQRFMGTGIGQQMSAKGYDLGSPSFAAQLARFGTGAVIDEVQRPIPYR